MSTKIHSGFRMQSRDIRKVLDDLSRVSKECTKLLRGRQAKYLAETATRILDNRALSVLAGRPAEPRDVSAMFAARDKLWELQAEVRKTRRRNPEVDYEIFFRLWLCRKTGAFIGYVRGEGAEEIRDVLVKARVAAEFSYWNNTDPPENLNARQWKKRADVWEDALANRSGPWFDIYVDEPSEYCRAEDVLGHIPTFQQRVNRHAEEIAFDSWYKKPEDGERVDFSHAWRAFVDFRSLRHEGDPTITAALAKAREDVAACLAPSITAEMLDAKPDPLPPAPEPAPAEA